MYIIYKKKYIGHLGFFSTDGVCSKNVWRPLRQLKLLPLSAVSEGQNDKVSTKPIIKERYLHRCFS